MPQSETRGAQEKDLLVKIQHERQVMQTNTVLPPETLHGNCKMRGGHVPSQSFEFHLNPLD